MVAADPRGLVAPLNAEEEAKFRRSVDLLNRDGAAEGDWWSNRTAARLLATIDRERSAALPHGPVADPRPDTDRLRQQNHEAAERRDRETAALQAEVDRWRNAAARAKELVRGSPVDWSTDPKSQEPDGWWTYTSQNNRDVLTAAVAVADPRVAELDFRLSKVRESNRTATERVAELRRQLLNFGRHAHGCAVYMPADSSCSCGWDDLRRVLSDAGGERP